ncbi:MAG: universal stress protein [Pseudomonadota bacterium]
MAGYDHVLLATDCADGNNKAGEHAVALAGRLNAKLSFLRVLEHLPQDIPVEPVPPEGVDKVKWFSDRALRELQQYAEQLGLPASVANIVVTTDSPEDEIIRYVTNHDIDLVVVCAHERHGMALFQRRTADNLVHNAPCDVLVVHTQNG